MNENELNTDSKPKNTYRATTNLNIDMENPQIHMNSAIGMNIKDVNQNNNFSPNLDDSFNGSDDFYKDYSNQKPIKQNYYASSNNPYQNPQNPTNYNDISNSNFKEDNLYENQNITPNNLYSSQSYQEDSFIPTNNPQNLNTSYVPTSSSYSSGVEYEPTMEERKEKKIFKIPVEVKITGFIVFLLLIFVLIMPYIYDFFKNLQLALSR